MKKITLLSLALFLATIGFPQYSIIGSPNNITSINDSISEGYFEDFESGGQDWTKGSYSSFENWNIQGVSGTGVSLGSNMMGVPHSGNYSFGGAEHSFIQSPIINTISGGVISFDFFVNNEPAFHDKEFVEISFDGGITWNQLIGDQLTNDAQNVQTISFNISESEGSSNTLLRFTYDTVDACCGAQDGFFIDNVKFEKENIATGIDNKNNIDFEVKVYPNPTIDKIVIVFPEIKDNVTITLTTINGKEIYNNNAISNYSEIDLKRYPKGVYVLNLFAKGKYKTVKIIKK
jgi:hypothetical protein